MTTHIVLIRHASIDAASRLHGTYDVPLSAAGLQQLRTRLSAPLTRPIPAALYTSPLTRAATVATALGRAWGLEPRTAPWAQEIHCGEVEGMPLDELQRRYPHLWAQNEAQADDDFAWPGGESYRRFRVRVLTGLREAVASHAGGRIAIVTHAGVISQVLGTIRHRAPAVWAVDRPDPFTATEVTWADHGPLAVVTYNELEWY